jgi:uncharacterized membrane protein YqaE (UPF0057 family)
MKKTVSLLLSALSFVLLSSSCASYKSDLFSKKKYYNFPLAKHRFSHASEQLSYKNVKPVLLPEQKQAPTHQSPATEKLTASTQTKATTVSKEKGALLCSTKKASSLLAPHPSLSTQNSRVAESPKHDFEKEYSKKISGSKPFIDADAKFIIIVLLAIFLPPVGIFLKNNNQVNNWFWLTLVLCLLALLGFGLLIPAIGPILWVAAAAIAILFVFDAI